MLILMSVPTNRPTAMIIVIATILLPHPLVAVKTDSPARAVSARISMNAKKNACEWKLAFLEYGVDCFDADECKLGNHDCGKIAQCSDAEGTFSYECLPGNIGDGVICSDVNEFEESVSL